MDAAGEVLIDAIYLYQQYHSPRCWKTEEEAFANFEGLKWKKDKLALVKEQILIQLSQSEDATSLLCCTVSLMTGIS